MIAHPLVTGVVLAGGRARRMGGADKAGLPLGTGGDTPLDRILRLFAGRFPSCLLVLGEGDAPRAEPLPGLEVATTRDRFPGCGPLAGIHAALEEIVTPHAFVCACDMPSLSGALVDLMARRAARDRLLVPVRGGRPEPLHALYPASCREPLREALAGGTRAPADFFASAPVDWLTEEEMAGVQGADRSFTNLNTPEDLER